MIVDGERKKTKQNKVHKSGKSVEGGGGVIRLQKLQLQWLCLNNYLNKTTK